MFIALTIALFAPLSVYSQADFVVFGVRTDFPMGDTQNTRKDFYVSIGTNQGVKPGTMLDAFRIITAPDEMNSNKARNITFPIAQLKVIHAQPNTSVARLIKVMPENTTPIGHYQGVMIGDVVSVTTKK